MAIKKACVVSTSVKNTGKECDIAMGATAMLIPISPSVKFVEEDLDNPYEWLNLLIHQKKAFPLFGAKAPIRTITNNSEADLLVTLDDGSNQFVRYGVYNRTFQTTSGGLCYAKALMSFLNSGMWILEIDQSGQILVRKNEDATMSGVIVDNMYSPSPVLGDLKDIFRSQFKYSLSPTELVNNGVVLDGASSLLSMMGLIDAELIAAGNGTTTYLPVKIQTECAEADLISLFGTKWNDASIFTVINKSTKASVTVTGVTNVSEVLHLAGTFAVGQIYTIAVKNPEFLLGKHIEGYEVINTLNVIAAEAVVTVFDTTIDQSAPELFSVAGTGFVDADQALKFNKDTTITGLPITMLIKVNGVDELSVDTYADYAGHTFNYIDKAGVTHVGAFTDGTVSF